MPAGDGVKALTEVLSVSPLYAVVVFSGVLALEFLRQDGQYATVPRPHLVLLDLNLPGKNGTEVLAEMRTAHLLRAIPVALLTTLKGEPDILRSYELGVNCFITNRSGLQSRSNAPAPKEFSLNDIRGRSVSGSVIVGLGPPDSVAAVMDESGEAIARREPAIGGT
jgi:CheY-like chemotaxis protein